MPDLSAMKLGRLPHDPAQIARMPRLERHPLLTAMAVPTYPLILDRSRYSMFQPAMDGNDRIGDCTAVGYANGARAAAALNGFGVKIEQAQTIGLYVRSCGYDPNAPLVDGENPTDKGGILADVLAYQAQHGFDATNQMLVGDFATIDPADLNAIRATAARIGMLYCGIELAVTDQNPQGGIWDTAGGDAGDPTPGSWGGHCLGIWDWTGCGDTDQVRLVTWGTFQHATWRWVKSRIVEAHALMWRDIGGDIAGIDYDRLKSDLATFLSSGVA